MVSVEENNEKEREEMEVQRSCWYGSSGHSLATVVFQGIYCAFNEGNRMLSVKTFVFFFCPIHVDVIKQDARKNKPFLLLVTDF